MLDPLVRSHGRRTKALLARILGDEEDARDAWQETWTAIWLALPRLRSSVDPWPFIRRAAVRKAIDRLRSRQAERTRTHGVDPDACPAPETRRGEEIEVDLSGLRHEERVCITLFFWEGCSVREIASTLDVPVGTVKTWMFRARARLRESLEGPGERREDER